MIDSINQAVVHRLARELDGPDSGVRDLQRTAIEYLGNTQVEDVRRELRIRFPSSMQSGDSGRGQEMYPVTAPIVERFANEQGSTYDRGVSIELKDPETGEIDQEATSVYSRARAEIEYDDTMRQVCRAASVVKGCALWHGWKRGKLHLRIVYPDETWGALHDSPAADRADPLDYDAFVFEGPTSSDGDRSFSMVSSVGTAFYSGRSESVVGRYDGDFGNPYTWPQVEDFDLLSGPSLGEEDPADRPLLPISFWHLHKPERLIPESDPDVFLLNREFNLLASVIFDTLRFQGHDTPVMKVGDPRSAKHRRRHGARFPLVLGLEEDFFFGTSSVSYSDQMSTIRQFLGQVMALKSLSPGDFSIEASSAISGFAKLVESLPKLQSAENIAGHMAHIEANRAWPCNASILIAAGKLPPEASRLRCEVSFPAVEFPRTPEEDAKRYETDFRYGFDTPAHVMARRKRISVEEAKERLIENAEINRELGVGQSQQTTEAPRGLDSLIGTRIGGSRGQG